MQEALSKPKVRYHPQEVALGLRSSTTFHPLWLPHGPKERQAAPLETPGHQGGEKPPPMCSLEWPDWATARSEALHRLGSQQRQLPLEAPSSTLKSSWLCDVIGHFVSLGI